MSLLQEVQAAQAAGAPWIDWPGAPSARKAPHLLHVFPGFAMGGSQARFAALAQAFGNEFRHTVLVLRDGYEAAMLLPKSAPVSFAAPPSSRGVLPARLAAYRRLLDRVQPDLLLTYNWGAIEFALANLGRGAHLHVEDGFGPEEVDRQLTRRVWFRRLALSRSRVVVPSLTLQRIALEVWGLRPQRVQYIPNGVAPHQRGTAKLESLAPGLPPGAARIVWVGGLRREKNVIRLLQAFAAVKDQAVLLVIGDGPERGAIEVEAARLELGSRLRMIGARSDVRDLIAECDVFALSSDTEQMPITVLEAMDAGLPVAACDVGDVRRMVAEGNKPFITPPNVDSLGAALAELVDHPRRRAEIGAANLARVRRVYSQNRMVEAYRTLFLSNLQRPA